MSKSDVFQIKFDKSLPPDYQEVLVANEMELQEGITVEVIRKLVYLYTRGMEYYDLTGKDKFRKFYNDKLISLLTRPDIVQFLDKNPIDFESREDLDHLFSIPNTKKVNKESYKRLLQNTKKYSSEIRRNSTKLYKVPINQEDIVTFVKRKILEVSTNLNKIDEAMTNEIVEQMTKYETNKRNKKIGKSPYIIDKDENEENKNEENNLSADSDSEGKEKVGSNEKKNESDIGLEEILNANPNLKSYIGKNPMLQEIEEYVQKNMNEMYVAFEELKSSFEDEIKEAEDNGFPEIAEGLKEDLKNELENLKDQYEEQRRIETEKIKSKYSKRNSILVS